MSATLDDLKALDLHDLAERLDLKRDGGIKGGKALYMRPGEKNASLSIFADGTGWKDFAEDRYGKGAISFYIYATGLAEDDWKGAADALRTLYGMPWEPDRSNANGAAREPQSREAFIAQKCLTGEPVAAIEYLVKRGVKRDVLQNAVRKRALGFNDWTKPGSEPGTHGHGGPAVAFIVRDMRTEEVLGVDFRYIDAALNGGVKTKTQGQKDGVPWFICAASIKRARTVYIFESAINALCCESCDMPGTAAVAIRGTGNADKIDWRFLQGKRVVACMDADLPDERTNERAGSKAAWALHTALTGLNIACVMVDQKEWYEKNWNDAADIAEKDGLQELRMRLEQIEPWAIAGQPGGEAHPPGRRRVFLPNHDDTLYWRYRTREDFTSRVTITQGEEGAEVVKSNDVAGFRVQALTRVTIQSATATMTGEDDSQPRTVFAATVQVPRHGPRLQRRVMEDDKLHNVDQWKKLGPVFNQSHFLRLLTILERTAEIGARDAVNFVGLCWRQQALSLNEGPDCYFNEPDKQCPYHNLIFPSGSQLDAQRVIAAYQETFAKNAATQMLCWALGGHLKVLLGFWPHCILQADKGSGKSTLIKRLERSIGMTMFGGQSLNTEFRLLTSISHTSHPVGWEEISARKQEIIDRAVALLQETYQFVVTRRGSEMTEYLQSAHVLLAGEDVPVKSLTGKVIRVDLSGRKGPLMAETLPRFPVREWIQYLATLDREQVSQTLAKAETWAWAGCRASEKGKDEGAARMVRNYAAIATGWRYLCRFAGIAEEQGGFLDNLRADMNAHISETSSEREPFVWILEHLASEIDSLQFAHPVGWDTVDDQDCILLRPQHVMDHIQTNHRLRDIWNSLPVKSGKVFKRQLARAGLIVKDDLDRRIQGKRHAHLTAISLKAAAAYGVHFAEPRDEDGNLKKVGHMGHYNPAQGDGDD